MSETELDDTDRAIVNAFQGGFPVCTAPYEPAAATLQSHGVYLSPTELHLRIRGLVESGTLSRFGPLLDATALGGATTLVAMAVPADRFEEVTEIVNGYREVAHNYERDHELNMWFVLSVVDQSRIPTVISAIEGETGLDAITLPKLTEFDLGAYFPVAGPLADTEVDPSPPDQSNSSPKPSEPADGFDTNTGHLAEAGDGAASGATVETTSETVTPRDVLIEIQSGLPLTETPYSTVAEQLEVAADWVIRTIGDYIQNGTIRRLGVIPNHYAIGYTENAMTVWDIPDAELQTVGTAVGSLSFVTHCYERPRHPGEWPYNFFAMVHGRSPEEASERVEQVRDAVRGHCGDVEWTTLDSRRILKKKGLRLQQVED